MKNTTNIQTDEGYTVRIIPEQRIKSCFGCKYYERQLAISGRSPIYICNCRHSEAVNKSVTNKRGWYVGGNLDGDNTPEWCPIGARQISGQEFYCPQCGRSVYSCRC